MVDLTALGRLGFGAASIGNLYRAVPDAVAAETIDSAWDAGLRYVPMRAARPEHRKGMKDLRRIRPVR